MSEEDLGKVISRCDICVVDLDGCIYPRFTQTTLGALILARSFHLRSAHLLPRLLRGLAYITATRFFQIFGREPANIDLMRNFSETMEGVPVTLLERCAAKLSSMGSQEWRLVLVAVASVMPVYLLTFSIEPIARAYARARDSKGRAIFGGYRGTPIEVRDGVFQRCLFRSDSFTPEAKARELSLLLDESGRERPLVIGHSEDEAAMFRMANERGGVSIIIGRGGSRGERLDASIQIASWHAISRAVEGQGMIGG